MALAALPADGHREDVAPTVRAFVTAADRPRALNELVGIERFVLDVDGATARARGRAARVDERREALAQRDGLLAVDERHQLAVPPHVRLAAASGLCATRRARRVQVVARQQRHAAGAEVMRLARIARRARRTATEHSRWSQRHG